mmetsp:Transcript_12021/g.22498  ORF Transcript_12021/g.22498 Transcript_12021/m.22498 type:complete len:226 (-) Transcript_12021:707-1384(-)
MSDCFTTRSARAKGAMNTMMLEKKIPPQPKSAVVLPPVYKSHAVPQGKYTAKILAVKSLHSPLPVRFNLVSTLKRGIPRPMMKKAKTMEDISVNFPNTPDIMDCNMLSATSGMVNAPRPPTNMYKTNPMREELLMADSTETSGFLSYNQAGTAITTAKLNNTTPNISAQSVPHKVTLEKSMPCTKNEITNWILMAINTRKPMIWNKVFSFKFFNDMGKKMSALSR